MAVQHMTDDLLTTTQVAERLKMRVETVRRMIRTGQLEAIEVGKKEYRIRQSVLDTYLAEHKTIPPPERGENHC